VLFVEWDIKSQVIRVESVLTILVSNNNNKQQTPFMALFWDNRDEQAPAR